MKKYKQQLPNERYNPNINFGLTSSQVNERNLSLLTNKVTKKYSKTYLSIVLENVCTFFNLVGIIVFIALLSIKASLSNFFFVFFYVTNTLIGIIQEIRAKKCTDKLSLLNQKNITVIRDGQQKLIHIDNIVLDDIIILDAGCQIPVDCIIMDGFAEVNESFLTGESVPVKKENGDIVLAGSFIVSGKIIVKAERVGENSYVQNLSDKAKKYKKPQSEIFNSLSKIIRSISVVILILTTAHMIKAVVINKETLSEAIAHTSTIIIGLIPAGMFLLTSLALSVGIIKLSKKNTLVQDLYSLEMLARVDTICLDKTGTITNGNMNVKEVIELNKSFDVNKVVSSMLNVLHSSNFTEKALLNKFGNDLHYSPISTLPFNSKRKHSEVTFKTNGTFALGAPEFILSDSEFKKIENIINEYALNGYRVILLAHSEQNNNKIHTNFTPISLIILQDNIRDEAIATVKWFNENNVNIKVISGDNPLTVSEVSKRVGIKYADKFISLEGKTDSEIISLANEYTVFGRVTPEQKAVLIKALRNSGHTTAMTGDGVNDILALKEANCAISIASGSEAARNVSHIVLLNDNFSSIPSVVYEGRRVINNVNTSSSLFFMKTLFTIFIASIVFFLPYMKSYPFKLPQMILLEVFVIGVPAFFLSLQPNSSIIKGGFVGTLIKRSLPGALLMVLNFILVETLKINQSFETIINNKDIYATMSVYSFTIASAIALLNICKPFNKYRTTLYAINIGIVFIIIAIGIIYGIPLLEFYAMPVKQFWPHILILGIIAILDVPIYHFITYLISKIKFLK